MGNDDYTEIRLLLFNGWRTRLPILKKKCEASWINNVRGILRLIGLLVLYDIIGFFVGLFKSKEYFEFEVERHIMLKRIGDNCEYN